MTKLDETLLQQKLSEIGLCKPPSDEEKESCYEMTDAEKDELKKFLEIP